MSEAGRLRGWKNIAAYLGVTQSTAMRWARDGDFPAMRTGNGSSVYALPEDLDSWLVRRQAEKPVAAEGAAAAAADPPVAPAGPATIDPPARARPRRTVPLLLAGGAACAAILAAALWPGTVQTSSALPAGAARMLGDARKAWAERTPEGLARAIAGFQATIARYPDVPGGFTGLADSYLLSCEYAAMPRAEAFAKARAAVTTALALAPDDPDAHRIRGFLGYWTDRDIDRAIPDFEAAVRADQPGYLAHLWYGNALVDAGRVTEGLRQLDRALAIAPDSPAILTDQAIAMWQAGDAAGSFRRLAEVERRFPQHSPAPGWSALFHLSRGETAAYLAQSDRWAALVDDPVQTARLARERAAWARGGDRALLRTMAYGPTPASAFWHGGLVPATIAASLLGDRARLIVLLGDPRIPGQYWRPLPFPTTVFRRWKDDPAVAPLLARAFGVPEAALWPH